jgi:hypothetical protein
VDFDVSPSIPVLTLAIALANSEIFLAQPVFPDATPLLAEAIRRFHIGGSLVELLAS